MKKRGLRRQLWPDERARTCSLDVLIVYDDLEAALRAKRSVDLMALLGNSEVGLSTRLWKLVLLRGALLREQAASEAAAADVIILSLHHAGSLVENLRDWLWRWMDYKEDRPYALGVLLDQSIGTRREGQLLVTTVQEIAEAAQADFFSNARALAPIGLET